jgi:flavodoxin I
MNVLIVFDTVFGNTEKIARAMGDALQGRAFVKIINIKDFTGEQTKGIDLLIVGSPTRQFRPTPAISTALKAIPADTLQGIKSAAFDTRINTDEIKSALFRFIVKNAGFAAKAISSALQKKGAVLVAEPTGFLVMGDQGTQMVNGEPERAAQWASSILPTA